MYIIKPNPALKTTAMNILAVTAIASAFVSLIAMVYLHLI